MNSTTALLLAGILLLGNAFFVAAEFALIAARRSSIEPQALAGSRRAKVTLAAMENVSLMMAGAQLGITVCSLGLGALGEPAIAHFLEGPLSEFDISPALLHSISFAIALTIMTLLHVVLGEMVPKNITLAGPDRSALLLAPMLRVIVRILKPAVVGLNAIANGTLRLVGVQPKSEVASTFTRDEVAGIVEESRREGLLTEEKEHLLTGTLQFDERTIRNILIPLRSVVSVKINTTAQDIEELVAKTGYSRLPVTNNQHELLGYIHVKDVLYAKDKKQQLTKKVIRPLVKIRETDTLRIAMTTMQKAGTHMAYVVNSRGQVLGIATLEDALEELVGEIRDESQRTASATAS